VWLLCGSLGCCAQPEFN